MEEYRKRVLIGVVISIFASTFVGGALTAYFYGSDTRSGIRWGATIGFLTSLLLAVIVFVFSYYGFVKAAMEFESAQGGMATGYPATFLIFSLLSVIGMGMAISTILGIIGGAIGGYFSSSSAEQVGAEEERCRNCGEIIADEAKFCPECGVSTTGAGSSEPAPQTPTQSTTHDPSQHQTNVSDSWYLGVIVSTITWLLVIIVAYSIDPTGTAEDLLSLVFFITWFAMPIAAYFDMIYIRANSTWNPQTILWIIGMLIWLVNIPIAGVYLYRRHLTLGTP